MLSAQVTRNTQSCFVLNWSIGETLETFLVDVVDVTPDSGRHARVRLLPWCGPEIKKRASLYFPHHRFPHVGILYLTFAQLLPATSQKESEVLPESPIPFPAIALRLSIPSADDQGQRYLVTGIKRYRLPSGYVPSPPYPSLVSRTSPNALYASGIVVTLVAQAHPETCTHLITSRLLFQRYVAALEDDRFR